MIDQRLEQLTARYGDLAEEAHNCLTTKAEGLARNPKLMEYLRTKEPEYQVTPRS